MKKGLGRGFDSLIPSTLLEEAFDPTAAQDGKLSRLQEIALADIQPDSEQPRRVFDQEALEGLASSIRAHGVLQPIVISPHGKKYKIVAGERRWRAAAIAGLSDIPAIIRTLSSQNRLEISLIENLQRRDLNAIETATAYLKLRDQFNMTLEQIGERVGGKSASAISNTLRLLKLPKIAQEAVYEGIVSEGQVRPMIGLPEKVITELLARVLKEDWSARRVEQWISLWKQSKNKSTKLEIETPRPHSQAAEHLASRLKTAVNIRTNAKGGGKIVIPFKSEAEFERIRELLS